jgi:transposase-like protein
MASSSLDITAVVGKLLEQDDVDALREGVRVLAQAVMETEASHQIGAAPYERSSERGSPTATATGPGAVTPGSRSSSSHHRSTV